MTTPVIIDFAHCGTTMLAGILEILGVPMVNERFEKTKWEDLEVIEAALAGEGAFAAIVEKRNETHKCWGFKWPGAWKYMPLLEKYLREPVYLAIYKDPVSVTWRRFGKSTDRWLRKFRNTVRQMKDSADGIYHCGVPVRMLSYQKVILKPRLFIEHVVEAVGIEPGAEQVTRAEQYIQPNLYGPRKRYPSVREHL